MDGSWLGGIQSVKPWDSFICGGGGGGRKGTDFVKLYPQKIIKPKLGMYFQKEAPQKCHIFAGSH